MITGQQYQAIFRYIWWNCNSWCGALLSVSIILSIEDLWKDCVENDGNSNWYIAEYDN